MLDFEGTVFQYTGGVVDFWIELETDGEKQTLFRDEGKAPDQGTFGVDVNASG